MNEIIYSIIDNIKNNKLLFKSIILLLWILFCTIILYVFFRNKNEWNINCECKDEKVSLHILT